MTTNTVFSELSVSAGRPDLQGATLLDGCLEPASQATATAVNFAVYSPDASQVWLCLFDNEGNEHREEMLKSDQGVWHLLVKGVTAGQSYGFRADGAWSPAMTPRFNSKKFLLDPYAREVKGEVTWSTELFDYQLAPVQEQDAYKTNNFSSEGSAEQWIKSELDSAGHMPRNIVRDTEFDWQSVRKPRIAKEDSVIYELHVKGFTQLHPDVPEELRGTFLGLCHPKVIDYFKKLGVTAVELLPVTSFVSEERLVDLGLSNYWGYNPLCLMAPEPSLAVEDPVTEMKTMVRELHKAGIEVIMDVVYNHTCESGHGGPSMSLRGLADSDYYLMDNHHGRLSSVNYTGCGNTVNFDTPQTLKLTMDSLRRWAEEYQIDGFRFDLAPIMARQHRHYQYDSAFFRAVHQDPLLSQCKMIAEPWDIGPDGYRLSGFPGEWQEWSDRFRDGVRAFWRGDNGRLAEMGWRLTASEDVFGKRRPLASINYICSHDGFNMNDLVSYEERHNFANGEENRDGDQHNFSCNYGVEGPSSDSGVRALRLQCRKNLLATLLLSRGTPMFMAGDEFGNTQNGNNNAYCQDNEISWMNWDWLNNPELHDERQLQMFVQGMTRLRREHPLLGGAGGRIGTTWFDPHGGKLNDYQLGQLGGGGLCVRLTSEESGEECQALLVMVNNERCAKRFTFPEQGSYNSWQKVLDTSQEQSFTREMVLTRGWVDVPANSVVVIEVRK